MILEKAEVVTKPGRADAFQTLIRARGVPLLTAVLGVRSVRFERGIEHPDRFLFLVVWDDLDAHVAFNASAVHAEFIALFADASDGRMEHFELNSGL